MSHPVVMTFVVSKDDYKRLVDVFGTEVPIDGADFEDFATDEDAVYEPEVRLSTSGEVRGASGYYRVKLSIEHYNGMEALRKLGLMT